MSMRSPPYLTGTVELMTRLLLAKEGLSQMVTFIFYLCMGVQLLVEKTTAKFENQNVNTFGKVTYALTLFCADGLRSLSLPRNFQCMMFLLGLTQQLKVDTPLQVCFKNTQLMPVILAIAIFWYELSEFFLGLEWGRRLVILHHLSHPSCLALVVKHSNEDLKHKIPFLCQGINCFLLFLENEQALLTKNTYNNINYKASRSVMVLRTVSSMLCIFEVSKTLFRCMRHWQRPPI